MEPNYVNICTNKQGMQQGSVPPINTAVVGDQQQNVPTAHEFGTRKIRRKTGHDLINSGISLNLTYELLGVLCLWGIITTLYSGTSECRHLWEQP